MLKKQLTLFILSLLVLSCGSDHSNNLITTSSCGTPITVTNANHTDIDNKNFNIRAHNCENYIDSTKSYRSTAKDVNCGVLFNGTVSLSKNDATCTISSNAIPNHNFNDGSSSFVNPTQEQNQSFTIPANPTITGFITAISLQVDNAVFLNGVKLDLLAAGCFGIADGKIGCHDTGQPFRYDPMSAENDFGTDSHNAHTQPNGAYHYHGNPNALFDDQDNSTTSPVIGFAADGFPIYGSYFEDSGNITKATSSYRLKSGIRSPQTYNGNTYNPGGSYNGQFIDDYEYVIGLGNLDECNGKIVNGHYGYYVTNAYPWVLKCFKGTPNDSFNKSAKSIGVKHRHKHVKKHYHKRLRKK